MGNCSSMMSSKNSQVIEVKPHKADEPETLKVKLNGKFDGVDEDLIKKKVCDDQQEFANRFTVEATKQKEFYLITVNALPGDEPGTVAATIKRLTATILKQCLPITDRCKIVSFKKYELLGEDDA